MNADEIPSDSDWQEWLLSPCTKALRAWAHEQRESLKEQWALGNFTGSFDVEMAVRNAGATGACSIYIFIEELDYQQIIEGDKIEEPKRPSSSGASSLS